MRKPPPAEFRFRRIDPPYGGYLALIPCVALAVGVIVGPYLGPALRMCTL